MSPGAPKSPVLLHVPHGSRIVPAGVRDRILLSDTELSAELDRMTDAHTGSIAEQAATPAAVRPWVFTNHLSRLVVDPERFADQREEMRAVGMGAVYTRTSLGDRLREYDADHEKSLLTTYFNPYTAAMTRAVEERLTATGRAIVLDIHSYPTERLPYELHSGPRPEICLGTADRHTPPWLIAAARKAFSPFEVDLNTPFTGAYVPLRYYRFAPEVLSLMIEIRRDRYMTEPGGSPHSGLSAITKSLNALIDGITPPTG
nr:N-formylglutamate amidohydrolase [Nocardia transvalensis]